MKKLFASFSGLLGQMADGHILVEDLRSGFFMFSCTRCHALSPGENGATDERTYNKGRNAVAYPILLEALLVAEKEGRAAWIRPDPETRNKPVEILNEMLARHGIRTLDPEVMPGYYHSLPELRDKIVEFSIPLHVIY